MKKKKPLEVVEFATKRGATKMVIPKFLTVGQLAAMGIRLELVPKEQPWKPGELRNKT